MASILIDKISAYAGADDPAQLLQGEEPQYAGLRRAVERSWAATRSAFADLRRRWFSALEIDVSEHAAYDVGFRIARRRSLISRCYGMPRGAEQAINAAIEAFLRQFTGMDRSREGFVGADTEDGILQQSIVLAHAAGTERGREQTRWPMNPVLTEAQRRDLLGRAYEQLTEDGRFRFETRLNEIQQAMLDAFGTGRNPITVAHELADDLDGYERGRLRTIVRTEMGYAGERGIRDLYGQAGVQRVEVIGDPNTDELCTKHIGKVYAVTDEANLPLYHPNCFCSTAPTEKEVTPPAPPGGDAGGGEGERSPHPDDVLIRELIRTGRDATPEEVGRVINRIATAPFNQRSGNLRSHLKKRIKERQWAEGTTEEQYVADLHQVATLPEARLAIGVRRGGNMAWVIGPTQQAIPTDRLGGNSRANCLVVLSADRGIIASGYQFNDIGEVSIPEDARWLR